jgi:phage gpG-like protein
MSKLSRFLKRQESNVRGLYDKNLGDFVEEWKRPVLGSALGMIPGAALTAFNPAMGAALIASGGIAGGAAGYQRTKDREHEWAAAKDREAQAQAQRDAGGRLDEITDPFEQGEPDPGDIYERPGQPVVEPPIDQPVAPPGTPPPGVPAPVQPPVDGPPIGIPAVPADMGNIDTGGPETGVGGILDEGERARQMQLELLQQQQQQKEAARAQLAEILNKQMERQFDEQRPEIYEDLNRRGLLRSTETGKALATERGRLSAGVNEQLALQGIQDMYGGIEGQGSILDQYLGGRQSAIGRRLSLADWQRQMAASKELGQAVAPIQPYSGGGKSGTAQAGMAGAGLGMQAAQLGKGG